MMQIEEFEDLIDCHGEDVTKWPESDRGAALALLEHSQAARALLAEAQELRRAFGSADRVAAPPALTGRILAQAMPTPALASRAWSLRPALILSFCFAIGFTLSLLPDQQEGYGLRADVPALLAGLWQ
jgi:hypothetical protein